MSYKLTKIDIRVEPRYGTVSIEAPLSLLLVAGIPVHWLDGVIKSGKSWGQKTFVEGDFRVQIRHTPSHDAVYVYIDTLNAARTAFPRSLPAWIKATVDRHAEAPCEPDVDVDVINHTGHYGWPRWNAKNPLFAEFMYQLLSGTQLPDGPRRLDGKAAA